MNRGEVEKILTKLRGRKDPSPLAPEGTRDKTLDLEIESAIPDSAPEGDRLVKSALHLWNDNLIRSHELSQEIKTVTGSYLHGIMHRREPDYGNSKYWFNRVGVHEAFPEVLASARELLGKLSGESKELAEVRKAIEGSSEWDGHRMVDWCQASDRGRLTADATAFLEALQLREISILADYCLARAKG